MGARLALTLMVLSLALPVPAAETEVTPSPDFAAVEAAIRHALPATAIDAIRPTPVPGLVEVVAGTNVLYADTSGRWLFIGHLYDLRTAADLTAERAAAAPPPRIPWGTLPLDAAVRYGRGPLRLAVLSDPDCPWCRKLHAELRKTKGIEVFEILYPVPSVHPDAEEAAVRILCERNPRTALDRVMRGDRLSGSDMKPACRQHTQADVAAAMDFGRKHAVRGTPTLIAPDGRTHAGYLPAGRLRDWLLDRDRRASTGGE